MKKFTGILPVLMIAILSAFTTETQGKVLASLLTGGHGLFVSGVIAQPSGCNTDFTDFTNTGCYPETGRFAPVIPSEGSGPAEVYSYPLATGTLTGNVKNCATNANLAGAIVTIVAGSPPTPYSAVTNAAGNFTITAIPVGTGLPVTATYPGLVPYGPVNVSIFANQTTTLNFCMSPLPALLTGFVTNAATGAPVIMAKVSSNASNFTYSTCPDGAFSLSIYPAYTGTVMVSKEGFDNYVIPIATYIPPQLYNVNAPLPEVANPPSQPFTAILNGVQTTVNLNWGVPQGKYLLMYDDCIEDAFAIWQTEGNLDAVKFTPPGYPATILGCMVNIGQSSDYTPPGHPVIFKIAIFDDNGPGGMPGNQISSYTDFVVSSTVFGWYDYPTFYGTGIVINSGSFYIVTRQVGNYPNAAGIAVDTTTNQLRSFQRFVTNNGPWVPVNGNFMIRAHMSGPGGPLLFGDNPENTGSIVGYNTWRLFQGQENLGPAGWTTVGTSTGTYISDNSWPSLPCQSYRWAVEAQYTGNRWSLPTFSNALGKCWTANLTVHVMLSCDSADAHNAVVTLSRHNPSTPPPIYDSIYVRVTDSTGTAYFNNIYKGVYDLTISMFGYGTYTQANITLMASDTIFIILPQTKTPVPVPPGVIVNDRNLLVRWEWPHYVQPVFTEKWTSGNFTTNSWGVSGSAAGNWAVSAFGNPSLSASFNYTPQVYNYDGYLTSKPITGANSTALKLTYDIYLSNYGTTAVNTMAVELWDGTNWQVLKTYTNQNGSIPWTTESLDIAQVTNSNFRIRFHAAGSDSYYINNWNIDNILITAENAPGPDPCILGFNISLNNVLSGFTPDTFYTFPCNEVIYGHSYSVWVQVIYGSGYSPAVSAPFTSHFLGAPDSLTATAVTNSAFLVWKKPSCNTGLIGYNIYHLVSGIDVFDHYVQGPDSLSTYCFDLDPGQQCFDVRAKYDLTAYGFPGTYDESLNENTGPACVQIVYGYPVPFLEPWEGGFLGYQLWTNDTNWIYQPATGNPAPSADFTWQPVTANYNSSLTSMTIDASAWTCATIWLDYDYKLNDRDAGGTEKMDVEAEWDNTWHQVAEYKNTGSISWSSEHFDISGAAGKGLKVRFRANGANTSHIFDWFIDNIHIYGIGNVPIGFNDTQNQDTVNLTWDPPQCGPSGKDIHFNIWGNLKYGNSDSSILIGYNVFRYDSTESGVVDFRKLNANALTGSGYTDVLGLDTINCGLYKYFVTAVYNSSETGQFLYESPGTDTITIQFPAVGVSPAAGGSIMIYPNPVNDIVNVKSDFSISRIEIFNFTGQSVYNDNTPNPNLATISTSSLQSGVYFIRITTPKGIRTAKFTVVR